MKRIVFMVGGPIFHPVAQQAGVISHWLGKGYVCELRHGNDAFFNLDDCDLLVIMGLFWEGMADDWAGNMTYEPLKPNAADIFADYLSSGRPVLLFHGGIASYPDDLRFSDLLGVVWKWEHTLHSPYEDQKVKVLDTGHPIVKNLEDADIIDEIYYNLAIDPAINPVTHATAKHDGKDHPMIITGRGGRVEGAGKLAYLANGHDMKTFESPLIKKSWVNAVNWLLEK